MAFILQMSLNIFGQSLTLSDLISFCDKTNWESINQVLLSKGWTYYSSQKGSSDKYNTITWSYQKEYYNDKALGWFYLYTYEGFPNKIAYTVFNKKSYSLIQNNIGSAGFKLVNSNIGDNEISSIYGNSKYTLNIITEKRGDDEWSDRSVTAYSITLIKKAGIYDPANGKKVDYNSNGNIEAEYTLKDGQVHGGIKLYYGNGVLKRTGNYTYGNADGKFVEYSIDGEKLSEYYMKNDKKNGLYTGYEDNKVSFTTTYLHDIKNGPYTGYFYSEEDGSLILKHVGIYLNGEENGPWHYLVIVDGKERVINEINYRNGIKHGPFQEAQGDSLIIGSYLNDEMNGKYFIYLDFTRMLLGGIIKTDTSSLTLITQGYYEYGKESGFWKHFDFTGTLRSQGKYYNGLKTGEWKYYYTNLSDDSGSPYPYSTELYLIQNYSMGKKNGKSTRFSYLENVSYPCNEVYPDKSELDTCYRLDYQKVSEISYYKDDKLNGPFEARDSINQIISKGSFIDDKMDGEWLQSYIVNDSDGIPYYIHYKGYCSKGNREGKWVSFITDGDINRSFTYKKGVLHGVFIDFNSYDRPSEVKQFNNGNLTELLVYDSLGLNPLNKYEIFDETRFSYKCRKTSFISDGYYSQVYWVSKDGSIDHNWFELDFLIKTGELSDHVSGFRDGAFKLFNSIKGSLITGGFHKDDRVGIWTFYYPDQGIKIEANYLNNEREYEKYMNLDGSLFSGDFVFINSDDNIKEIRKIKDGYRNGKTTYIDINTDKTIKKETYKAGVLK